MKYYLILLFILVSLNANAQKHYVQHIYVYNITSINYIDNRYYSTRISISTSYRNTYIRRSTISLVSKTPSRFPTTCNKSSYNRTAYNKGKSYIKDMLNQKKVK